MRVHRWAFAGIVGILLQAGQTPMTKAQCNYTEYWITVSNSAGPWNTDTLYFGNYVGATYGIDGQLGPTIIEQDYPPPSFMFDIRFIDIPSRTASNALLGGIKPYNFTNYPKFGAPDTFNVQFLDSQHLKADFTFRWPNREYLDLRCDSMCLEYSYVTRGTDTTDPTPMTVKINMFNQDSATIIRPQDTSLYESRITNALIVNYGTRQPICELFPDIWTPPVGDLRATSVVLMSRVDPNCYSLDSVKFEYGTTMCYGNEIPATFSPPDIYSASITGLSPNTLYHYRVSTVMHILYCPPDTMTGYDSTFKTAQVSAIHDDKSLPKRFSLRQNYPNPFNPTTAITFELPASSIVSLKVFDLFGREVTTLVSGQKAPGEYNVTWDGSATANGIYFYRLIAGNVSDTRKMVLAK